MLPQMAPSLWTSLYLFFTISFTCLFLISFFMKKMKSNIMPIKINKSSKSWSW